MFCPGCGAGGQKGDAYCKRCGEWLPQPSGLASRALWGQGVAPERKLRTILVRQVLSAVLALALAVIIYARGSDFGRSPSLITALAILCFLVFGMQVDGLFIALRMRRDFKHNRDEVERAPGPQHVHAEATTLDLAETKQLDGARADSEETTRQLNSSALGQKRAE